MLNKISTLGILWDLTTRNETWHLWKQLSKF